MNDAEKGNVRRLIAAGDKVMEYRAHLSDCAYENTEFCTCGRREAADNWKTVREITLEILKQS